MTYEQFKSSLAVFDAVEKAGAFTEEKLVSALEQGAVMMQSYADALAMYRREVTH